MRLTAVLTLEATGFLKGGQDHLTQREGDIVDLWQNDRPAYGKNGTYSTEIYGPEARRIVLEHNTSKPLFLYLPFQVTHSPYEVPSRYLDPKIPYAPRRTMAAMATVMDEAVGNLTAALAARDMLKDSLIIFSADKCVQQRLVMRKTALMPCRVLTLRLVVAVSITPTSSVITTPYGMPFEAAPACLWTAHSLPRHRGQKTSSWEGGVRVRAFLWGGENVLPARLRGTTFDGKIHICDWVLLAGAACRHRLPRAR